MGGVGRGGWEAAAAAAEAAAAAAEEAAAAEVAAAAAEGRTKGPPFQPTPPHLVFLPLRLP